MIGQPSTSVAQVVDGIYATVILSGDGRAARFYWARCLYHGTPLILLDWEADPLVAGVWEVISSRIDQLVIDRRARSGSLGIFVEGAGLAQQAELRGFRARAIPDHLTKPIAWFGLCQVVATLMAEGQVGYTEVAKDKMATRPFLDEAGIHNTTRRGDDPAVPAFIFGVILGLDEISARPAPPSRVKVVTA